MTETIGAMTALDAVNEMLNSIGEANIATIVGTIAPDATTALSLLYAASRDLQEQGWHFNTEKAVTISLDGDSKLPVPSDALRIDGEGSIDVVQRGGFLWNRDDNTYVFDDDMDCTVVRHLAWDYLPQVVRKYVTALAINDFHAAFPPPAEFGQRAERNFQLARANFESAETDVSDYNVLTGSLSVSSTLRRGG